VARRSPPPNSLGKSAKSNFISLHRVEYLALIGPEVESSNVRELEGSK
jgi:hypothetical protein